MPGRSSASTASKALGGAYTGSGSGVGPAERPSAKQRIEISAVVGMSVADVDGVQLLRRHQFQKARQHRVARIDQKGEALVA